jgi:hypothetical protein
MIQPSSPRERGQDLVEYAITLPLFLILVFAIFDIGRGVYYYSAMYNAAREGARYGSVHPAEVGLETTICNLVVDRAIAVDLTCDPVGDIVLDFVTGTVTVNISFSYTLVTPIVGTLLGINPINMSTSSTMEMEYIP